MGEHPHHFVMLSAVERDGMQFQRGINLAQIASFEYAENGPGDSPVILLMLGNGVKAEYRAEDARHIYRLLKGRY